jgi:hypothetical protein
MDYCITADAPIRKFCSDDPIFGCVSNGFRKPVMAINEMDVCGTWIWINFIPLEDASNTADLTVHIKPDSKEDLIVKDNRPHGDIFISYKRNSKMYFLTITETSDNPIFMF